MRKILDKNIIIYLLLSLFPITILIGCVQQVTISPYPEFPIKVKAEIVDYSANALHEDYEDGGWATYDATTFKIILPVKYEGKEIFIYHDMMEVAPDSIYRKKGLVCEFIIDERAITEGDRDYFISAIEDSFKIVKTHNP